MKQEQLDRLTAALEAFDIGRWLLIEYTTTTGKKRSVKGLYHGVQDNYIVVNNGRNNRVPVESTIRITVKNDES